MTGMKEKLGDKYPQWYARHRLVENQRVWRIAMEKNPINPIPEYERTLPPTYSLEEAFYHPIGCPCGSCDGPLGSLCKYIHVTQAKDEPWVRGATSPLPQLPHQILRLLQDAEEVALSPPDHSSSQP